MTKAIKFKEGSFEYLETKLRKEAKGTAYGKAFEKVIKKRLIEARTEFKPQFQNVWLWEEWPKNWGIDKGIDLIAEDKQGKIWAIQVKNYSPDYVIPKSGIDSFISESERKVIDKRMLIATTDKIGPNAKELFSSLSKKCVLVMRGDLKAQKTPWPTKLKEKTKREPKKNPRPDQKKAIDAVLKGFKKHNRGRLIRACGTGKTLISLWVKEKMKPKRTLVLFPSISLVAQTVESWNKERRDDYEYLIICSDETTDSGESESASSYGIDVTTDAQEIHGFLKRKTSKPTIVFCTYQSSKLLKEAQEGCPDFDLIIFDEAHRCTGYMGRQFTFALDDKNIRGKKRLFMTATERYIKQVIKDKAGEVDFEIASMDDEGLYGPVFSELSFGQAIKQNLLNNYQVAIVVVSEEEAKEMVEKGKLIKTRSGILSDARTMATQMAIAKAMKKYDITKMITFHSSVKKAKDFIDENKEDSLPSTIKLMKRKPAKDLWFNHISGKTPASQRKTLLEDFKALPKTTRALLTNCACLKEGVDIPALDGIAFVDPKSSIIDIVQAVGRAIRKTPDNKAGTILVPVFINPDDEEEALDSSAFKIVGYVLKALQQHDESLKEELEGYRMEVGKRRASGNVRMPSQVKVDIHTVLPREFEQNLLVKIIKVGAKKADLKIDLILEWMDSYKKKHGDWPHAKLFESIDESPEDTWPIVDGALNLGSRGLPKNSSLAKLLKEHRGVRHIKELPDLSVEQILKWADDYKKKNAEYPNTRSGKIEGTEETWTGINTALIRGTRQLPKDMSLAKVFAKNRGLRVKRALPILTYDQIIEWAKNHHKKTGKWPTAKSGKIIDCPNEKWSDVDGALFRGNRGLQKTTLANLLASKGLKEHKHQQKPLTVNQVLGWADAYKKKYGKWPNTKSGKIKEMPQYTWLSIDTYLQNGVRGLPSGSSLAKLLSKERGLRNSRNLPSLSESKIIKWAKDFNKTNGKWPNEKSGEIPNSGGETWRTINKALYRGSRGFNGGSSLNKLFTKHRLK